MISSLLIANRGEIAVRIIRACKEMGIRSVLVYSTADKHSYGVQLADESVCIGSAAAKDSYLNIENIIAAASIKHCDAIHPGVGFMAENAFFATKVQEAGFIFIGPSADVIEMLGDKIQARETAKRFDIPVTPGFELQNGVVADALARAEELGYPVILKASSGGGGKGMRIVRTAEEMESLLYIASSEAMQAYGNDNMYIEKYLESPRHVEVQILCDSHGNVVHLGERDCTVQKNHQKLVEESPCVMLSSELREKIYCDAIRLFQGIDYIGAATIEFLLKDDCYYFMEINTRVQVEHPVSEMVSGIDIIKEQIMIASGMPLSFTQDEVHLSGYAVECRVNALMAGELKNFLPPGGVGVRTDTFMYSGYVVQPFYDSMLVKVIVYDTDRKNGLIKMSRCLDELVMDGIDTNIDTLQSIITSNLFKSGNYGTDALHFIEKENMDGT